MISIVWLGLFTLTLHQQVITPQETPDHKPIEQLSLLNQALYTSTWKSTPPMEKFTQDTKKISFMVLSRPDLNFLKIMAILYDGQYSDDNKLILYTQDDIKSIESP